MKPLHISQIILLCLREETVLEFFAFQTLKDSEPTGGRDGQAGV